MNVCTIGLRPLEHLSPFIDSQIELEQGDVKPLLSNANPDGLKGKKVLYIAPPENIDTLTIQDLFDEHSSCLIRGIGADFYTQRSLLPSKVDCVLVHGLKSCNPSRFFSFLSSVCKEGGKVLISSSVPNLCLDSTIRKEAQSNFSHVICHFGEKSSVMILQRIEVA